MIRLILVILAIVVACTLTGIVVLNPGTAEFEFFGLAVRTSFALAFVVFLLGSFLMLVIWWAIYIAWTAPEKFRRFSLRRRRERGFEALERALIASAAGEGETAVRQAARADALLDRPALSRLLAARAAEAAGNLPGAEAHYEAMLEDPKTRLVARRGLAQIAHERGEHAMTVEHARIAFSESKSVRWAFAALFDAQVAQGDWDAAMATLAEGEKRRQIEPDKAKRRRAVLLTAAALGREQSDTAKALTMAELAAQTAPGFAPASVLAARLMGPARRHKKAESLLKSAWAAAPHPAIARALADLRKSDTKAKRAERLRELAALRPEHRESRILMVEAGIEAGETGLARAILDPLLEMGTPTARLSALASRLARMEGDDREARRWMTRASHAPGEADWSDIDGEGRAFPYPPEDWKRMVYAFGDEGRLLHPRHERYEIAAGAVPETALLEAPRPARAKAQGGDKSYYSAPRPPDDPGVGNDEDDENPADDAEDDLDHVAGRGTR